MPSIYKALGSNPTTIKKGGARDKNVPDELVKPLASGFCTLDLLPLWGREQKSVPKGISGAVADDDVQGPELEKHFVRP